MLINDQIKIKNRNRTPVYLVALACFFSNISQLPVFVSSGMTQKINIPMWGLLFIYILINNRVKIYKGTLKIYSSILIVCMFLLLFSIITDNHYFQSSLLKCLILSIFIYSLGSFVGTDFFENDLKFICLSYVLSATIVAISIYLEYFSVGFDITSRQYAYASKNSISQIIFTAIVILMFIRFDRVRILNLLKILVIIFDVLLLILLKSRATIIGFAYCLLYIIFKKQFNRKLKYLLIITVIVGTLALILNDKFFNLIVYNVLFAGRNVNSLDSLASGRITILSQFPQLIKGHLLTGVGALYFECFPLSCILQFGVIAGFIIIGISYLPIIKGIKYHNPYIYIYISIFTIISIGYGINSFFEGLAPIGPGVKCYFMWLMYGILSNKKDRLK